MLIQRQLHTCDFLLLFPFLQPENIVSISCTLALLSPFFEIFMRTIIKHVSQGASSLLWWSGYLRIFLFLCIYWSWLLSNIPQFKGIVYVLFRNLLLIAHLGSFTFFPIINGVTMKFLCIFQCSFLLNLRLLVNLSVE